VLLGIKLGEFHGKGGRHFPVILSFYKLQENQLNINGVGSATLLVNPMPSGSTRRSKQVNSWSLGFPSIQTQPEGIFHNI